jgi:thioredoxin-dependent peroxiredoxin
MVLEQKLIRLGDIAPDFLAQTTEGMLSFHKWIGESWCILFSHPKDFTPVCTTELGMAAKMGAEFQKRKVKILALSVGNVDTHKKWIPDINHTQKTSINFPIIADEDHHVSELYGMIHPNSSETATVRNVFIIDSHKIVRLIMAYPSSTGRNFNEILRVIDSMQLADKYKVVTPVNWLKGEACVVHPNVTDLKELKECFPKMHEQNSYLRWTPDPSIDPSIESTKR